MWSLKTLLVSVPGYPGPTVIQLKPKHSLPGLSRKNKLIAMHNENRRKCVPDDLLRGARMPLLSYSRQEDHIDDSLIQHSSLSLDSLLGTWVSTTPSSGGIAKFEIVREDGLPVLQIFGVGPKSMIDWGKTSVETVYTKDANTPEPMAFQARYDLGFMEVHVQGNFSLGLMVLACLNIFKDDSGRTNYFSREFFYRTQGRNKKDEAPILLLNRKIRTLDISRLEEQPGSEMQGRDDTTIAQFIGDWTTTNPNSRGIARAVITSHEQGLLVHAFGAGRPELHDWGIVQARVLADGPASSRIRAFHAVYDFGFLESYLQAKTEKGVLVVATFNRFKDQSGRSSYFSREFFARI
jgi:hypothetical protein